MFESSALFSHFPLPHSLQKPWELHNPFLPFLREEGREESKTRFKRRGRKVSQNRGKDSVKALRSQLEPFTVVFVVIAKNILSHSLCLCIVYEFLFSVCYFAFCYLFFSWGKRMKFPYLSLMHDDSPSFCPVVQKKREKREVRGKKIRMQRKGIKNQHAWKEISVVSVALLLLLVMHKPAFDFVTKVIIIIFMEWTSTGSSWLTLPLQSLLSTERNRL